MCSTALKYQDNTGSSLSIPSFYGGRKRIYADSHSYHVSALPGHIQAIPPNKTVYHACESRAKVVSIIVVSQIMGGGAVTSGQHLLFKIHALLLLIRGTNTH